MKNKRKQNKYNSLLKRKSKKEDGRIIIYYTKSGENEEN